MKNVIRQLLFLTALVMFFAFTPEGVNNKTDATDKSQIELTDALPCLSQASVLEVAPAEIVPETDSYWIETIKESGRYAADQELWDRQSEGTLAYYRKTHNLRNKGYTELGYGAWNYSK